MTSNNKSITRRIAYAAVFTALAIALSIMENYFPVGLLIPVPGIKLGLANVVTIFAIVMLKPVDTIAVILTRCLVVGLFTGPVALMFSLTGAMAAWLVMTILNRWTGRYFSVIGISIAGAVMHSFGQAGVAVIILKDWDIMFYYLPFLMIASLFTGTITGMAAIPVINNFGGKR